MIKILMDGHQGRVDIKGNSTDIIEEYVKASVTLLDAVSHNIDVPEMVLYKLMAAAFEEMAAGRIRVDKDSVVIDMKAVRNLMRGSEEK